MTERIKVETELIPVWVIGEDVEAEWFERWATEEMIERKEAFNKCQHSETNVTRILRNIVSAWPMLTTENPHTPKVPWSDVIGDDENVWEYEFTGNSGYYGGYKYSTLMQDYSNQFRGFLHKLGDGTHVVYNSHLAWTDEESSCLSNTRSPSINIQTTLVGVVMAKEVE